MPIELTFDIHINILVSWLNSSSASSSLPVDENRQSMGEKKEMMMANSSSDHDDE